MTTSHESQPLEEMFRFCTDFASRPHIDLNRTLILHIAESDMRNRASAGGARAGGLRATLNVLRGMHRVKPYAEFIAA